MFDSFPSMRFSLTHLWAALPLATVALSLPAAAESTPGLWKDEVQVNSTAYIPLENIRGFYKLLPQAGSHDNNTIVVGNGGISLTFHRHSCEAAIGGYRIRLSHPAEVAPNGDLLISKMDAVKLIDPILRPTYISPRRLVRTVVLDPGHGGRDTGTIKNQVREADLTLLLAGKLKTELAKRGFTVLLTREQNHPVSDSQRVDVLKQADAPIFISLHVNNGRSDTKGIETYALQPAEQNQAGLPGNSTDEANIALAFSLHGALLTSTGADDGACRRARFSLLNSVTCPSALVQLGYATHAEESAALNSEEYQNKLVLGLAEGISTFAQAVNPDAKVPVTTPQIDTTPPEPYKADVPAPKREDSAKNTGRNRAPRTNTPRNSGNKPAASRTGSSKPTGTTNRRR